MLLDCSASIQPPYRVYYHRLALRLGKRGVGAPIGRPQDSNGAEISMPDQAQLRLMLDALQSTLYRRGLRPGKMGYTHGGTVRKLPIRSYRSVPPVAPIKRQERWKMFHQCPR
jgi:hypothetical protein